MGYRPRLYTVVPQPFLHPTPRASARGLMQKQTRLRWVKASTESGDDRSVSPYQQQKKRNALESALCLPTVGDDETVVALHLRGGDRGSDDFVEYFTNQPKSWMHWAALDGIVQQWREHVAGRMSQHAETVGAHGGASLGSGRSSGRGRDSRSARGASGVWQASPRKAFKFRWFVI